ncbi:Translin-1 [Amphichorda felina]
MRPISRFISPYYLRRTRRYDIISIVFSRRKCHLLNPRSLEGRRCVCVIFSPTNPKDRDAFHITIEEYLLSLTDLMQDLSCLATNAITLSISIFAAR